MSNVETMFIMAFVGANLHTVINEAKNISKTEFIFTKCLILVSYTVVLWNTYQNFGGYWYSLFLIAMTSNVYSIIRSLLK